MTFEELTPSQQAVLKRSVKLAERNICWPFAGYKMAPALSSARSLVKKGLMIASSRTGVYFPSKAGEELVKDYKGGNNMSTPFPVVPDAKLLEVYHNDPMVNSCVRMGVPMEEIIIYMAKRHKDVLEELLKKDFKTCPSYTYIEIHSKPTA